MESEGEENSRHLLPSFSTFFFLFAVSTATQKTTVNILTSRVPAKAQKHIYFKVKRKQVLY